MALPDDPTKVSLPQMKTPGLGSPPAATPVPAAPAGITDPLAALRVTMQQAANVSNAPAPAPAPLHSPDTGAAVLPTLQAADAAVRAAPQAISDNVLRPVGAGIAAAGGAIVDAGRAAVSAGQAENQRIQAMDGSPKGNPGTIAGNTTNLYSRAINAGLDSGFLSPDVVQRRGLTTPEQQQGIKPAPAALPQASYSNEGRVTNADIVMPKPAAAVAPAAAPMAPANRTPVSDPYSGPAAGMINPNVTPTSGVEDGMRQLQNLRALSDMTPMGGANALSDQAAEINAANDKRRTVDAVMEGMNKAGTRTARAGFAQLANTLLAGETQRDVAAGNQQVQLAGQANQSGIAAAGNQVQMRGQTLTNNLGMRQIGATERGQTLQYDTSGKQITEQARGHDLQHDATLQQVGATLQGQKAQAASAAANIQANKEIHAANNATQLNVAERNRAGAVQSAEFPHLPPNVKSIDGRLYVVETKNKKTTYSPFGMPAPQ